MSSAHEVITIQVGNYANFIGAHWWNMQEASFCYSESLSKATDICPDVLFREGLNIQNDVTFTPRLLSIDTKSSLRTLKKDGTLHEEDNQENEEMLWDGPTTVLKQNPAKKIDQQGVDAKSVTLEDAVQTWSDYLTPQLHTRSICLLDEHFIIGGESSLESYGCGIEAYNIQHTKDMIEDRLRQYVEECDFLQGFQIIADGDNGYSAVSNSILQHLDDEYQKIIRVAFPVFSPCDQLHSEEKMQESFLQRLYSTANGFNTLNELAQYFSPLSVNSELVSTNTKYVKFPLLNYKPELKFHTSAILATMLECITAPYRLRNRKFLLSNIAENLVLYGRKVVSAGICSPFVLEYGKSFDSVLSSELDAYNITPVTPYFKPNVGNVLAQLAVLRGISDESFKSINNRSDAKPDKELMFGRYLKLKSPSSLTFLSLLQEECAIPCAFPKFFEGCGNSAPKKIAAVATLCNSSNAGEMVEELLQKIRKNSVRLHLQNSGSQLEKDDFSEVIHNLNMLKDNYGPDFCD